MSRLKKKRLTLSSKKERDQVFLDIIGHLSRYNDDEKKKIALEADVHWGTLYNWCAYKTINPHINTLSRVARVMGYQIVLKRTSIPRAIVRRIK